MTPREAYLKRLSDLITHRSDDLRNAKDWDTFKEWSGYIRGMEAARLEFREICETLGEGIDD